MSFASRIETLRGELLDRIQPLLPTEQTYVQFSVRGLPTIKYLDGAKISYNSGCERSAPYHVDELSIEQLHDLYQQLI